jgi:hypothetical protein
MPQRRPLDKHQIPMTPERRLIGSAPVGHRQPRVSDVPSENSARVSLDRHRVAFREECQTFWYSCLVASR